MERREKEKSFDLIRAWLRWLLLDLVWRQHELFICAFELGILGQGLAKLIDLLRPHQPDLRSLLHELTKLLQEHQGLCLVA